MITRTNTIQKNRKSKKGKKPHSRMNKGLERANMNRTNNGIRNAHRRGESPKTNKKLAEMMDRAYGTNFVANFHTR